MAAIIGFGPNLWTYLRRSGLRHVAEAIFALGTFAAIILAIYIFVMGAYQIIFETPRVFAPTVSEMKSASATSPGFTRLTLGEIRDVLSDNTDLAARHILQPEFGKFIAITGTVLSIREEEGGPKSYVSLRIGLSDEQAVELGYDLRWVASLLPLKKGDRAYAICKLQPNTDGGVSFTGCVPISR